MFDFLADPEVLNTILMILGLILTFIINRAAGAFTAFTGIQIEAKHRDALHSAIKTYVESSLKHGHDVGIDYLKANTLDYLKRSIPDALAALVPGDGVLDKLVERYAAEALATLGTSKR